MAFVSRGFRGRRAADADPARVPPGQYVTREFPVLSAGPTPHSPLELWDFSIVGELEEPRGWSWEEFRALPSEEITRDIHCVTKWSKLDTVWRGVSVNTLVAGIETAAEYVTHCLSPSSPKRPPPSTAATRRCAEPRCLRDIGAEAPRRGRRTFSSATRPTVMPATSTTAGRVRRSSSSSDSGETQTLPAHLVAACVTRRRA